MPSRLFIDLSTIDLDRVIYDVEAIERINLQRYEMRHLDGIIHLDTEAGYVVGFKDVTDDEFWVRGHIPGRPLFPGVLMIEAAAQLASFAVKKKLASETRFVGFGGVEHVKFRMQVTPGQRLYLIGKFLEVRPRRFKLAAQGVVENQLVFEATVIGMPM